MGVDPKPERDSGILLHNVAELIAFSAGQGQAASVLSLK
jgi:hypothetical protein